MLAYCPQVLRGLICSVGGGGRRPSLIPTVILLIHTRVQSPCASTQNPTATCTEYDPRHNDPKAHGQTATRRVTCIFTQPSSSWSPRWMCPLSLKTCQALWIPDPRIPFHFCSSCALCLPVWNQQAPSKPLEIWSFLVLLQGNPLSSEAVCEPVL